MAFISAGLGVVELIEEINISDTEVDFVPTLINEKKSFWDEYNFGNMVVLRYKDCKIWILIINIYIFTNYY